MTIRLKIETLPPVAIGPNKVLAPPALPPPRVTAPPSPVTEPSGKNNTSWAPVPETTDRMINLVERAFKVLNATNPTATEACWLCYETAPPYYEAIGHTANLSAPEASADSCRWQHRQRKSKLTMSAVSGKCLCIGDVPATHAHLCSYTVYTGSVMNQSGYLIPPSDGWWACGTGLTPCVSLAVLKNSRDYCVLVQLVPRLIYHPDESFVDAWQDTYKRAKREPVSMTLAVLLGLGVATGIGTGVTALAQQPGYYNQLREAIDVDIQALEDSVSKLQESLTSLSEVVMQNRRGLDLLFLQQGGLCAALKEECCFYLDHSGVVKDSMAKVRERLAARQRERESRQGWFESWFNKSPWFTTLISTLLGPLLIILLLLLTFGPCVLNRLVTFIRERISSVQVLMLRQHYQTISIEDEL